MELAQLIPLLRKHGVLKFKNGEVEIEFESQGIAKAIEAASQKLGDRLVDAPEPKDMPPDLRADDLFNEDKVLNWSAPQSQEDSKQESVPLTGDMPIGE